MKINEITNYLESLAPLELQEDYDNSGFITGDKSWNISNILVCLDCNEEVVEEAITKSCNLIVTTTSANESLIKKSDIKPGTHITAVGSDTPEKRELDSNILGLANLVVVDSVSQCVERGETKYALEKNIINRSDLVELGDVIMSKNNGRLSEDDITVADLTGVAVQDIMITNTVYNNLNQL